MLFNRVLKIQKAVVLDGKTKYSPYLGIPYYIKTIKGKVKFGTNLTCLECNPSARYGYGWKRPGRRSWEITPPHLCNGNGFSKFIFPTYEFGDKLKIGLFKKVRKDNRLTLELDNNHPVIHTRYFYRKYMDMYF